MSSRPLMVLLCGALLLGCGSEDEHKFEAGRIAHYFDLDFYSVLALCHDAPCKLEVEYLSGDVVAHFRYVDESAIQGHLHLKDHQEAGRIGLYESVLTELACAPEAVELLAMASGEILPLQLDKDNGLALSEPYWDAISAEQLGHYDAVQIHYLKDTEACQAESPQYRDDLNGGVRADLITLLSGGLAEPEPY
ncbi:hypothetical protein [Ferrimonas marina]|uniref:Uncharacterized protein n=1 Tax=Ferrimonas marina TaxID=299255 RepID=A0A1M5Y0T3_9GAMM|nr:hypothetical protein [Ferrimonas marina]SHI05408.1 hypothetical protein SAMN02745129_3856 [Ferrimonas marina]